MPPTFVPRVDIQEWENSTTGLNYRELAYFKHVCANPGYTVDQGVKCLHKNFGVFEISFDATHIDSVDDVVTLLDAGASSVFVRDVQLGKLRTIDNVDLSRVVLFETSNSKSDLEHLCQTYQGPLCLVHVPGVSDLESVIGERGSDAGSVYVHISDASYQETLGLAKAGAIPLVSSQELELSPSSGSSKGSVVELLFANATTDRADGLFTTLVLDERGIALGLVYSSKESVAESLKTGRGVYQSRKRGLWYKGDSSGDVQELMNVSFDCDKDCLCFAVRQRGRGFCHLATETCFGQYQGLAKLQKLLRSRKESAPPGSYTARLFNDSKLLNAKIREEASELCDATEKEHVAWEAGDLLYFAMTKCIAAGVSIEDVERDLDAKSLKVKRRKGDAKPAFIEQSNGAAQKSTTNGATKREQPDDSDSQSNSKESESDQIKMNRHDTTSMTSAQIDEVLKRPSQRSNEAIMDIVKPIISSVRNEGDKALLSYTHKFEKATSLTSPVIHAPYPPQLMNIPQETIDAINVAYDNIRTFHAAQKESKPLEVETMPGVVCSRFSRPIERVGLYVPGGTAVLPSTALMLGVPAMVAGCKKIVLASPPRSDGSVTPEIVYIAHKIGVESIVLAGGAQAVAALAYGTESISKVDKILGPGNQFVTAGKMLVSNDTSANVSIDMPAGPSEVLVVADATSNPAFVASDLLSQAEHGHDSQVICVAVGMEDSQTTAIEAELHKQAMALPRVDIVRGAISHSVTLSVPDINAAMTIVNKYAPEHLIVQTADPDSAASLVENAGSVFIGPWTPESVGDYSAGVNHSLPTYGYARQYSGVNLSSYIKHITSSKLTPEGLKNVSGSVMRLASIEELEAHRRAVEIRLKEMKS
ncbi:MAG: trifunctional histidinol dehydrogenase [Alyxoria varia]|nr:MAG: trifunctional histidinol dehydrogenase [Alyxoria varia]